MGDEKLWYENEIKCVGNYYDTLKTYLINLFQECKIGKEEVFSANNSVTRIFNKDDTIELFKFLKSKNFKLMKCQLRFYDDNIDDHLSFDKFVINNKNGIAVGTYFFVLPDTFLFINFGKRGDGKYTFIGEFMSTNFEMYKEYLLLSKKFFGEKKDVSTVFAVISDKDNIKIDNIGDVYSPLERGNYSPEIIESYDFMVKEISSSDPSGKIFLLQGPPGGGKSYMIKGLITDVKSTQFIIIPSSLISKLDGPTLLPLLLNFKDECKSVTFILEDADLALIKRNMGDINAISTILNISDGIVGSFLDIRIIATTNAKKFDFDEAILRDGRLGDIFNIDSLPYNHANKIYQRLTNSDDTPFYKNVMLSTIYRKAHKSDIRKNNTEHKAIGFIRK